MQNEVVHMACVLENSRTRLVRLVLNESCGPVLWTGLTDSLKRSIRNLGSLVSELNSKTRSVWFTNESFRSILLKGSTKRVIHLQIAQCSQWVELENQTCVIHEWIIRTSFVNRINWFIERSSEVLWDHQFCEEDEPREWLIRKLRSKVSELNLRTGSVWFMKGSFKSVLWTGSNDWLKRTDSKFIHKSDITTSFMNMSRCAIAEIFCE